jgi:hypothetical protein
MTRSGGVKTCETDTNNKQVISKKNVTVSATDTSKNKGNHTLLISEDSHTRGCAGTSDHPNQKVLIIGDSHVRGLADNISSNFNDTFYVMGNITVN